MKAENVEAEFIKHLDRMSRCYHKVNGWLEITKRLQTLLWLLNLVKSFEQAKSLVKKFESSVYCFMV